MIRLFDESGSLQLLGPIMQFYFLRMLGSRRLRMFKCAHGGGRTLAQRGPSRTRLLERFYSHKAYLQSAITVLLGVTTLHQLGNHEGVNFKSFLALSRSNIVPFPSKHRETKNDAQMN
jgi:hypothetical protein